MIIRMVTYDMSFIYPYVYLTGVSSNVKATRH